MKPSPESDRVYLAHMLECIARVQSYTAGGGLQFRSSQLIQDAVVRNLQVMAESSQRLSAAAKANASDIPWRSISGFRNLVVHVRGNQRDRARKNPNRERLGFHYWWRNTEPNPRPQSEPDGNALALRAWIQRFGRSFFRPASSLVRRHMGKLATLGNPYSSSAKARRWQTRKVKS